MTQIWELDAIDVADSKRYNYSVIPEDGLCYDPDSQASPVKLLQHDREDPFAKGIILPYEEDSIIKGTLLPYDEESSTRKTLLPAYDSQDPSTKKTLLPPYDEGPTTRRVLLIGFTFACIFSFLFIAAAIYVLARVLSIKGSAGGTQTSLPILYIGKLITLPLTLITTVLSEVLGYIHTITLRWALASEGRLRYNSNLRLFTASRRSRTNGTWANAAWFFCLVLCYGGAANALTDTNNSVRLDNVTLSVYSTITSNGACALAMGFGYLGLCILTGIAWRNGEKSGKIKSWNPNPLNTALACTHHGLVAYQEHTDDSVLKSDIAYSSNRPLKLKSRQRSAQEAIPLIRRIVRFLLSMFCIFLGMALVVWITMLVLRRSYLSKLSWNFFPGSYTNPLYTSQLIIPWSNTISSAARYCLPLLWSCAWQSLTTITLHIAEFVVNVRRDETCWRRTTRAHGAKFDQSALGAAFNNRGTISLLILKPVCQWLFSLGVFVIGFNPIPLLLFALLFGVIAVATLLSARHKPKGALPAAYGHIQTMVSLIDDWGHGAVDRMYWGDKGFTIDPTTGNEVRCAGTSGFPDGVGEIDLSRDYILMGPR